MKMLCVRVVCLGEACLFGVEGSWRAEQLAQQVGQRWGLRDVRLSLEDGTQVPGELALGLCCEERGTRLHAQGRAEREERREEKRENNSNDIDVKRSSEWVRLNVGGVHVVTTRSTLCRDANSMLARMFAADSPWAADRTDATGAVLLDLEARYFMPVLHFLRFGRLVLDAGVSEAGVRDVAAFLQVQGVLQQLQHLPGRRNDSASGAAHFMLPNSAAAAADVQQLTPKIKYHNVMILACRLASWIGLSGAVPLSVPLKFKVSELFFRPANPTHFLYRAFQVQRNAQVRQRMGTFQSFE